MEEYKVKSENYVHIQGWMVTDLHLKGNELLVYAIIYGFSQLKGQVFKGSLKYLADWTQSTKQGIIKVLKSLEQRNLIVKIEKSVNNVKVCEYYATEFNTPLNNVEQCGEQSLTVGIQQSLPNILLDDTINDTKVDTITIVAKRVLDYLNEKAKRRFTYCDDNLRFIKTTLKKGHTEEDCRIVIDKKVLQWKNDAKYSEYLRPMTLFGTKFESYLNAPTPTQSTQEDISVYDRDDD